MNLFEIYEAAAQQADHSNTTLDADYLQDYVSGVYGTHLPRKHADLIMECYSNWSGSEKGSHNKYVLLEHPLSKHEITVD